MMIMILIVLDKMAATTTTLARLNKQSQNRHWRILDIFKFEWLLCLYDSDLDLVIRIFFLLSLQAMFKWMLMIMIFERIKKNIQRVYRCFDDKHLNICYYYHYFFFFFETNVVSLYFIAFNQSNKIYSSIYPKWQHTHTHWLFLSLSLFLWL